MPSFETIIIGAGFAGAATARGLVAAGVQDVLLLDQEKAPGVHSSGRNAGMVRRAVEDPAIAGLAREGANEIARLGVPYRRTGSFLIGGADRIPIGVREGLEHRVLTAREAVERVPLLEATHARAVMETPADGTVDIHALLFRYLDEVQGSGATVRFGVGARGPRISAPGGTRRARRVEGIDTDDGPIACENLVIAAGAWAGGWGDMAGIPVRLEPRRRHLVTTRYEGQTESWPWVWDLDHGFYFRPESAGLLWSPCDDDVDRPGDAQSDPNVPARLAEKVTSVLPRAGALAPLRWWAGHRTFTPDGRFLLGPDPRLEGWYWAAGLGGHGVTVSAAVGKRVAQSVLGRAKVASEHACRDAVMRERVRT